MKFTADTKELSQASEAVRKVASVKSDIQTLTCILIQAKDNELILTAYNLQTGIKAKVNAKIKEEGSVAVDAKTFADIIKNLPDWQVEVKSENSKIKITSGESVFDLMGINADEFPELPEVEEGEGFTINHKALDNAIKQTIFSASKVNTGKVIHTGVKFEAHDGLLRLISTDGFRLSYRQIQSDAEAEFVVPTEALYELPKLCQDENVKIYKSSRHISFQSVNYTLISRLLEGEFLNYRSILDTIPNTSVRVNASALQEALSRVSIIVSDKLASPIKAVFGDNSIHLEASTPLGKAEETIAATTEGEEITIGFNSGFVGDALKAIGAEDVVIGLKDAVSPIILNPTQGEAFKYLVLPVRLKG